MRISKTIWDLKQTLKTIIASENRKIDIVIGKCATVHVTCESNEKVTEIQTFLEALLDVLKRASRYYTKVDVHPLKREYLMLVQQHLSQTITKSMEELIRNDEAYEKVKHKLEPNCSLLKTSLHCYVTNKSLPLGYQSLERVGVYYESINALLKFAISKKHRAWIQNTQIIIHDGGYNEV